MIQGDTPEILIARTVTEASRAAHSGAIELAWEASIERHGYFRVCAQIPLNEGTFDELFNGRAGYRAQYYLSPEEGILFNRDLVEGVRDAIKTAYEAAPLAAKYGLVEKSMLAPHSKFWIYRDRGAFDEADADTVNPSRWVASGTSRGRKAPLPRHLKFDFKGTFIHPETHQLFIDDYKLDRAWDLFKTGYT